MVSADDVLTRTEGGELRVLWGTVASLIVAAPVYAVFQGYIGLVDLVGSGVRTALTSPVSFFADVVRVVVGSAGAWARAAWVAFLRDVQMFGPFAWVVTVLAVIVTFAILTWGVGQVDL